MKSARINFGIGAESEYVLEVDDTGVATRCFNPVTGQELGIGGGDLPDVTSADEGKVLAVNASGEWAAENKLVRLIMDPDTQFSNLTVREVIQAFIDGAIVYESGGNIDENDPSECGSMITFYGGVEYDGGKFDLLTSNGSVAAFTLNNSLDSYFYFD